MIDLKTLHEMLDYSPDTGKLTWARGIKKFNRTRFAGKPAGGINKQGYISLTLQNTKYSAHRIVWYMYYGEPPKGFIDHINHDKCDNRISNLRQVTAAENAKNRTTVTSSVTGHQNILIDRRSGNYVVQIRTKGTRVQKQFKCIDTAIEFRDATLTKLGFHKNHTFNDIK